MLVVLSHLADTRTLLQRRRIVQRLGLCTLNTIDWPQHECYQHVGVLYLLSIHCMYLHVSLLLSGIHLLPSRLAADLRTDGHSGMISHTNVSVTFYYLHG